MSLEEHIAQRKVQSLIKGRMLVLEEDPYWATLPVVLRQAIRKAVVRAAWDGYKTGLISNVRDNVE